jgi:hypothetical protein
VQRHTTVSTVNTVARAIVSTFVIRVNQQLLLERTRGTSGSSGTSGSN